jgi:hypothetical protein
MGSPKNGRTSSHTLAKPFRWTYIGKPLVV